MSDIHARAKQGIKLLLGRQVAVQILTFAGGVVLARTLGPSQFGLYVISQFLVSTFALMGDFGIAFSFIQRKSELTDHDLQVGFTLQQIITSGIVIALLIAAPWLVHIYPKAPPETIWLVRAMAFNLYLTSWRSMSALQLERHLRYDRLARVEVVEALSYQAIAVGLALTGFGVWSYVAATITQGILGTVLVYRAAPWPIRFAYDKTVAASILRYGLPFQFLNIANSLGGWATPILVGSLIGPIGVGYVTWASSNGKKPLILTDIFMRVALPHFSRIQDNTAEVERILLRYLTFLLVPAGLWLSVLIVSGHSLVQILYSDKWIPAVPALILFAVALHADVFSYAVTVTLTALGKVAAVTRVYVARSVAHIIVCIALIHSFGFNSVPISYIIVFTLSNIWLISIFGWSMSRRMITELTWLVLPAVLSVLGGELLLRFLENPLLCALCGTVVTAALYCLTLLLVGPQWLKTTIYNKLGDRASSFRRTAQKATE